MAAINCPIQATCEKSFACFSTLGSATVTEEDLLLDVSDVTTTKVAAKLSPEQVKDSSGG